MEQKWLACSVSPGQFPTEYAMGGTQSNGKVFSLFAPKNKVVPPPTNEGDGFIQVAIVDQEGDLALVRFPAQTFENGSYITVRASQLHPHAQIQEAASVR